MEPRLSFVTLGVTDLQRATRFYEEVLGLPRILTPPEVTFFELGKTWLALYPRELLAADAGVPAAGSGFPGFTLAHNVRSAAEVDELLKEVAAKGGRIVKPEHASRGREGRHGLLRRSRQFLWEVARNPQFPHT
jgi:catechol 2,3-dioxygenase-like lactoylglutathione lyase family enzyme